MLIARCGTLEKADSSAAVVGDCLGRCFGSPFEMVGGMYRIYSSCSLRVPAFFVRRKFRTPVDHLRRLVVYRNEIREGTFATAGWRFPPNGWLAVRGFNDFAGSAAVHAMGGFSALAAAIVLGPRIGKYSKEGNSNTIPGHNLPLDRFEKQKRHRSGEVLDNNCCSDLDCC